jgi:hypothetical protein
MKKFIYTILLAGFFLFSANKTFACTASQSDIYVGQTANITVTVTCQGTTCHSPNYYAYYPELITINSTQFDSVPFSGTRNFTVNATGNSVGANILGISLIEDGNGAQCASGGFYVLAMPTPTQVPGATYTANSTVMSAGTSLMGSMVSGYFGIIPVAIGIVAGLMVTLFLVRKLIGWVRGNMHG